MNVTVLSTFAVHHQALGKAVQKHNLLPYVVVVGQIVVKKTRRLKMLYEAKLAAESSVQAIQPCWPPLRPLRHLTAPHNEEANEYHVTCDSYFE